MKKFISFKGFTNMEKEINVIVKKASSTNINAFEIATTICTNSKTYFRNRLYFLARENGVSIFEFKLFDLLTGEEYSYHDLCA